MAYKVLNKAPKVVEGEIISTTIDIKQDEPYTVISRKLDGDKTQTSDNKLIEQVLEIVHDETTSASEIKNSIKRLNEEIGNSKELLDNQKEILAQMKENNDTFSDAFEELAGIVYGELLEEPEDEEELEDDADKGDKPEEDELEDDE